MTLNENLHLLYDIKIHESFFLNQNDVSEIDIFDSDLFLYTRILKPEGLKPGFEYKIPF